MREMKAKFVPTVTLDLETADRLNYTQILKDIDADALVTETSATQINTLTSSRERYMNTYAKPTGSRKGQYYNGLRIGLMFMIVKHNNYNPAECAYFNTTPEEAFTYSNKLVCIEAIIDQFDEEHLLDYFYEADVAIQIELLKFDAFKKLPINLQLKKVVNGKAPYTVYAKDTAKWATKLVKSDGSIDKDAVVQHDLSAERAAFAQHDDIKLYYTSTQATKEGRQMAKIKSVTVGLKVIEKLCGIFNGQFTTRAERVAANKKAFELTCIVASEMLSKGASNVAVIKETSLSPSTVKRLKKLLK